MGQDLWECSSICWAGVELYWSFNINTGNTAEGNVWIGNIPLLLSLYFLASWPVLFKVAEHSFGSLWVYFFCQIMARESCSSQAESYKLFKNTLMKDWLVKFELSVVSMTAWMIEYNLKIFTFAQFTWNSLIRFSYKLTYSLL